MRSENGAVLKPRIHFYQRCDLLHDDFGGLRGYTVAKRSIFILDEKDTLRYRWVSEDPGKQPEYDEIKKALSKI